MSMVNIMHIICNSQPLAFAISIAALITTIGATMYMHMYAHGLAFLSLGFSWLLLIMGLCGVMSSEKVLLKECILVRVQSGLN